MYQKQVDYLITLTMLIDSLVLILGGHAAAYLTMSISDYYLYTNSYIFVIVLLMLIFTNNFVMSALGLYSDIRASSFRTTAGRLIISVTILFMSLMTALYSFDIEYFERPFVLTFTLISLIMFTLTRLVLDFYLERRKNTSFNARQILLVGDDERAYRTYQGLDKQRSWGHQFVGYLSTGSGYEMPEVAQLGTLSDLKDVILNRNVDEVIFALPATLSHVNLRDYIDICEKTGVSYRIVPAMFDPASSRDIRVETIQGIPTLTRNTLRISPTGMLYKRLVDYAIGMVGMAILAVMMPIIGLAIKLDSPGPIIFRQPRVGQNGRVFNIYKFRTMVADAEKLKAKLMAQNQMKGCLFKMEEDPRITRVGKWLRKFSLDEFPQFINVVKGEMSVVGTRPPTLNEVAGYEIQHRRRISIKPGITGLWQVSGRNKITDFEDVVHLDLEYIDRWSIWRDLGIIFKTIWVVIMRKGAC